MFVLAQTLLLSRPLTLQSTSMLSKLPSRKHDRQLEGDTAAPQTKRIKAQSEWDQLLAAPVDLPVRSGSRYPATCSVNTYQADAGGTSANAYQADDGSIPPSSPVSQDDCGTSASPQVTSSKRKQEQEHVQGNLGSSQSQRRNQRPEEVPSRSVAVRRTTNAAVGSRQLSQKKSHKGLDTDIRVSDIFRM